MKVDIMFCDDDRLEQEFMDVPRSVYKDDNNWVSPLRIYLKEMLDQENHPFYKNAKMQKWVAVVDGKTVGRVAAIVNYSHNRFHQEQCGFFGFFESINEVAVAKKLLTTAERQLKLWGLEKIRGPVNPSTNYECGVLVHSDDDPPQFMMTYNPKYYPNLIEQCGYTKAMDLYAFATKTSASFSPIITGIANRVGLNSKVACRNVDFNNWKTEVNIILDIYNASWEKNWGFVPFSAEEFRFMADGLKNLCRPELSYIVEVSGQPAGVLIAIPDFNQVIKSVKNGKLFPTGIFKILFGKDKINRLRVPIMGVKKEYRRLGLAPIMYKKLYDCLKLNSQYKEIEMSWILENNVAMIKAARILGCESPYKVYRIYEKNFNNW